MPSESGRFFEVSKVRIGADGHVSDVLWGEVDAGSDRRVGEQVRATAAEVVDALHDGAQVAAVFPARGRHPERNFRVVEHADGRECIAFDDAPSPGRELGDMAGLDEPGDRPARLNSQSAPRSERRRLSFAVSKVRLDPAGRITAVLWGPVDLGANAWAAPEQLVPVGEVVDALDAGAQVFALFPSTHGHVPDRQFQVADYDGSRRTIVLRGPTAHEREVHDMDRLDADRA
jgi:hypothetical protein